MPFTQYKLSLLRPCLLALCFLCLLTPAKAQQFGGLRPGIKWQMIDTDTCRIIFPDELQKQGQRIANTIHYLRKYHLSELGDKAFKIDIVLNNQTTVTNGFVGLAPWRSYFFSTPLQNSFGLSATAWMDLLSIHEYRHVIQRSTARRGITKLFYYLFGEESWAAASSLAVPDWFAEGDAVWSETVLTGQGRGRIPNFLKGYRALALEENPIPYVKARNGSIRDYVPDHYRLGYLMVDYGQEQFGYELWKDVFRDASAYRGLFYPFSNALRRGTGSSTRDFYDEMIADRSDTWKAQAQIMRAEPVYYPQSAPITFTDHLYPRLSLSGDMIYFERSYHQTGAFFQLEEDASVHKLISRGISSEIYYGYNQGWMAWTEMTQDPRWVERNYSNIILYHELSDKKIRVTTKGKFFAPQPSADGSKIVAVEQGEDMHNKLVIIDSRSGSILRTVGEDDWFYTFPQWHQGTERIIAAVRSQLGEMALVSIDLVTDSTTFLLPFRNTVIGTPWIDGDEVVYSAYHDFAEQVFMTRINDGATVQLTLEPNGAFQPYKQGNRLFYTVFSSMGHQIKQLDLDTLSIEAASPDVIDVSEPSGSQNITELIPDRNYEVEPYKRIQHAINVHSWGFDFEDPVVSLRALSTNVFNNLEASVGLEYDYDIEILAPYARISLATQYPVVDLQATTFERTARSNQENIRWQETNVYGALSVPLDLSSGLYLRSINTSLGLSQIFLRGDLDSELSAAVGQITMIQRRIRARKNLFTHNGQYLQVRLSESLNQLQATQLLFRSALAFRGIGVNHNLILHADYKGDLEAGDYQFTSGLSHRGLGLIQADKMWRLSANYHLPITYPDWGLWGMFYVYRIRANAWYEHTRSALDGVLSQLHSVGIELTFDMNFWNTESATFGIRTSYALNPGYTGTAFEFFIPVYRF